MECVRRALSLGEDVFRASVIRWCVCGGIGQWHWTVGERGHGRFGGSCIWTDLLGSDDLDYAVLAFAEDRAFHDLAVGFALEDFSVESYVRVEEGFRCDILQDMNLVLFIKKDFGRAVGNKPSEAVGAEDLAALGIFDADIELRAVGQAVREDCDIARLSRSGHSFRNSNGLLENGTPVRDLDVEGRGVEGALESGGVDGGPNAVAAEFSDRKEWREVHGAGQLLTCLQNEWLVCVVQAPWRDRAAVQGLDLESKPMVAVGITKRQRVSAEVGQAHGDQNRLIADVESALELDVHLQLRGADLDEAEEC